MYDMSFMNVFTKKKKFEFEFFLFSVHRINQSINQIDLIDQYINIVQIIINKQQQQQQLFTLIDHHYYL